MIFLLVINPIINYGGGIIQIRVILLTIFGLILLLLGFIGIFLPVLPTTPFVLAGIGCLSGTPKLRAQVLKIRVFREYFENYKSRQGLSRKTVISSLTYLWSMLIISMFIAGKLWLVILETVIGICVTLHILAISKPKGDYNP